MPTGAADPNPSQDATLMALPDLDDLLKAGVHFGHQTHH